VHRGDVVAVVDTEKAVMDVESFEEGVVAELLVDVGVTVPVGGPMARITQTPAAVAVPAGAGLPEAVRPEAAGSRAGHVKAVHPKAAHPKTGRKARVRAQQPVPERTAPEKPAFVSPPVRHLAHQLGVDAGRLHGTGRNGALTRADVEHAVAGPAGERAAPGPAGGGTTRVRSSPLARRLAAELGVDLGTVAGTGPAGAVTQADVRRASEARAAVPAPAAAGPQPAQPQAEPPLPPLPPVPPAVELPDAAQRAASLRRAVGALMARSKKSIPHYYLSTTVDLRAATAWMREINEQRPVSARLVPSALLLKASALAARDIPDVNGFFTDGTFRPSAAVHLGVAVALRQGGLVAPAIHHADTLSLDALMEQLRDLVSRARGGRLQRAEMADPTITVTNLGDLGVESVYGVIYPPQVAMVGFGKVVEQPWAQDGLIGVRHAVTATLSADHRVSDGLRGGRFLARVEELLQKPEEL
jgi:pyruvate dehydrogenase E2 component (dihydrolipoamide acetyltransferase)